MNEADKAELYYFCYVLYFAITISNPAPGYWSFILPSLAFLMATRYTSAAGYYEGRQSKENEITTHDGL